MKCYACGHESSDFIQIRQVGVNNFLITGEIKEPEIYFKMHICPVCGNLLADPNSIKTKIVKRTWDEGDTK